MNKLVITLLMAFYITSISSCTTDRRAPVESPPPHSHNYPFTEVLGKAHHVRLIVNHAQGEMALLFEDISEKPVKIIRAQKIIGEVELPDSTVKKEIFRSVNVLHKGHWTRKRARAARLKKRLAGDFVARGEWIKTTPQFDLRAMVPFQGTDYNLTFQYKVPGGSIPFHRK